MSICPPVATMCRALPRQRLDLFTIRSSPRKFVECWYCDVGPLPSLSVLSRLIEFTCHIQLYSHKKLYIHPYELHSHNHTLILSRIHTFKHTQHIHNINSHIVASVTQSLVWSYPFSSVLTHHCAKWQVLTKEQLVILIFIKSVIPSVSGQEMSLINHYKWQVSTNEQFEPFQKCHPSVSGQEMSLVHHFKWQVLNNGQLEFIFYLVSSGKS